jgi:hypothetical protein
MAAEGPYTITGATIPYSYLPINTTCCQVIRCTKPCQACHSILSQGRKPPVRLVIEILITEFSPPNTDDWRQAHYNWKLIKIYRALILCNHKISDKPHARMCYEALSAADPRLQASCPCLLLRPS